MTEPPTFKLSICIATFNRAKFIGETIESIITQATRDCEVVISDNASTDNTEEIVSGYTRRFDHLRYIKQESNTGPDRNFDRAVELARGEYCWLMSDDDLLKPGAVATVLEALRRNLSLVLVNVEFRNFTMSRVLQHRWLNIQSDRSYGPEDRNRLFAEAFDLYVYVGSLIVRRAIWIARDRQKYYGCQFIHIAVIFQEDLPGETLLIAEPLVSYRMSNTHSYEPDTAKLLYAGWPSLIESLPLSASAKNKAWSAEPWNNSQWLLLLRGAGLYSSTEYRQWIRPRLSSSRGKFTPLLIAWVPGVLVNVCLTIYFSLRRNRGRNLEKIKQSPFYFRTWLAAKWQAIFARNRQRRFSHGRR